MNVALVFKGVLNFCKKNWKIIAIILGAIVLTGFGKRFIGRIKMWWSMRNGAKVKAGELDYNLMAIGIHDALSFSLFSQWTQDENAAIELINQLNDMGQFLELCRKYVARYNKDLREVLRKAMNDKQYAKLIWR